MLSNQHFYHRVIRKMVVSFGTLFNNIKLYRYNKAGTTEIERITVPLTYANKEKFYDRIVQDPNLARDVQVVLPRMAFEMTSINYDPLRKTSSFIEQFAPSSGTQIKRFTRTPYNFDFSLYVYVRNTEDGTQIVEQILPFFNPDHTLTVDLLGDPSVKTDVPIILQTINQDISNAQGEEDQTRTIIWTLTFTIKGWLYGPVNESDVIRKATANVYQDNTSTVERKIFLNSGFGNYKSGELAYQGIAAEFATASGFVKSWDNTANVLILTDPRGTIEIGKNISGAVSNASWNVSSSAVNDYQLVNITVTPDPLSANINTAFGFDTTIEEAPYIT